MWYQVHVFHRVYGEKYGKIVLKKRKKKLATVYLHDNFKNTVFPNDGTVALLQYGLSTRIFMYLQLTPIILKYEIAPHAAKQHTCKCNSLMLIITITCSCTCIWYLFFKLSNSYTKPFTARCLTIQKEIDHHVSFCF